jgi:DNA-binding NarL/FixJ family response regulator
MHFATESCSDGTAPYAWHRYVMNILLVEDSDRIALRIRELLAVDPDVHIIATVRDQQSAVDIAREADVDVMILDLQLAAGTGFGVIDALGTRRPKTIVMTNYALPQYRDLAERRGVEYFLDKSVDFDQLPEIIDKLRHAC